MKEKSERKRIMKTHHYIHRNKNRTIKPKQFVSSIPTQHDNLQLNSPHDH